ncbi:MAG: efflux RND transporter permease subunit [Candidatus Riflebacteria bacterium]|nr:efflux RND transporter permease subunit [Candidatus Riflebacteria bacterium]
MLERLIETSLKHRLRAGLLVVSILAIGGTCAVHLPIDAFPDVTNIQVEIISTSPGRSPLEMEQFVTYPIEKAMRGLPRLVMTRSVSRFGLSSITVIFEDSVDVYFARQLVMERLLSVKESLPDGVDAELGPVATAMGEIFQYTLEWDGRSGRALSRDDLTQLRTLQDWVVTPLVKTVPGVSEVDSFGGYIRQYQILIDPDSLLKYDLTLRAVFEAVRRGNKNVGGGYLERHSQQFLIRGIGLARTTDDIGEIVLKSQHGTPVRVRDVAEVVAGQAVRQGAAFRNGTDETVGGVVMMLKGENSRLVTAEVKRKVALINAGGILPRGVHLEPYYDRSEIVEKAVKTVEEALSLGVLFVVIVLYLFLRSLMGAAVVVLALPLAGLTTFIVMKETGMTANLMSLGGLIISIGMIIDAAIIQVENVRRHLSEMRPHEEKISVVLRAILEVRRPSILGELIIALTFLPLLALEGMEGKLFIPLAVTIFIALMASLILSILVVPVLCYWFLKPEPETEGFLMVAALTFYLPVLRWAFGHRGKVLFAVVLLFGASVALYPFLGREFLPVMDEGAFDMDCAMLPGVSLTRSLGMTQELAKVIMKFPEMETLVSRTGWSGIGIGARGVESTGYVGIFKPTARLSAAAKTELINRMRAAAQTVPGLNISFSQPIQCRIDELVAGTRSQLVLKLFGDDMTVLTRKANEIAEVLKGIRGTTDLMVEQISGQPYIEVRIDRQKIARYGLELDDVQDVIEIALGGKTATRMVQGDRYFDLVLRYGALRVSSEKDIGKILVDVPKAEQRVPLEELARIVVTEGPVQVGRENGMRRLLIQCNIDGRDIGGYVAEARARVRDRVKLAEGYYLEWGGQFENQRRALERLTIIVPAAILLIFFLLLATFDSARQAALVLLNLPLALPGGIFALYVSGLYLSVPASVGFIVLFGVAVLNGVVLVSYINTLREEEPATPLDRTIVTACERRLRPVLMTASVAVLSLTPMIFASGPGSEVQRPLAVVVVGGLVTSTLLTLLVLPLVYSWMERSGSNGSTAGPAGGR